MAARTDMRGIGGGFRIFRADTSARECDVPGTTPSNRGNDSKVIALSRFGCRWMTVTRDMTDIQMVWPGPALQF